MSNKNSSASTWPTVQLSEVAEHCLGKMLDGQKNKGRLLPYLRNPNVRWLDVDTSDLKTMPFEPHEDERYGLREGDVVVCEGGEAGRAAIWDGRLPNLKFQKAIHRVRPGPKLDARYLVHRLMSDYHDGRLADYYTGATIKHLTGQDLARYRFLLPPLKEQRRIAEILDKADALRAKRRAALAQLDTLTQSIFLDMFGDPATILNRWPTERLGDVLDFLTSGSRGWAKHYSETGDLFLRIQNVRCDELMLDDIAYVKAPNSAEARRTRVEPGDVLLSITADLGRTAVFSHGLGPAFISQHLSILRTKALEPRFLSAYLSSPGGQRQVFGRNRHAVKAGLNFDDIRSFVVPMPPMLRQQEFMERVTAVEGMRTKARSCLREFGALFSSLQHRAFRGEL
jgi:type I restriction enzyme, S subunit